RGLLAKAVHEAVRSDVARAEAPAGTRRRQRDERPRRAVDAQQRVEADVGEAVAEGEEKRLPPREVARPAHTAAGQRAAASVRDGDAPVLRRTAEQHRLAAAREVERRARPPQPVVQKIFLDRLPQTAAAENKVPMPEMGKIL